MLEINQNSTNLGRLQQTTWDWQRSQQEYCVKQWRGWILRSGMSENHEHTSTGPKERPLWSRIHCRLRGNQEYPVRARWPSNTFRSQMKKLRQCLAKWISTT